MQQPEASIPTVDDLDLALIEQLRANGRATVRSLAKTLEIREAAVRSRLRRLEETRVIRVIAMADFDALGYQFLLHGKVKVADRSVEKVARQLAKIPEVITVASTLVQFDLLLSALARDRAHLNELTRRFRAIVGVDSIRWDLALDIPLFRSDWGILSGDGGYPTQGRVPTEQVDELDMAIIDLLGQDARSSNVHIADQLGVSEGTVRTRISRMEEDHIIHITVITDLRALGMKAIAIVGMHVEGFDVVETAESVADVDGVITVMTTLGEYDVFAIVAATSRRALVELVSERIRSLRGVRGTDVIEIENVFKHSHTWAHLG